MELDDDHRDDAGPPGTWRPREGASGHVRVAVDDGPAARGMVGPTPRAAAPFAATSGPPGPGPHAAARPSPRGPRHRGREARPCGCCAEWSRRRRPRPDPKVRTSIHNWASTSSSMSGESVASRFASRLAPGTRSQANAAAPGTSEHVREESVRCVAEQPARWGRRRRIQRHDQGSFGQDRCPAQVRREPNQPGVGRELHDKRGRLIDPTSKGLELAGTFCWAAGSLSYCCRVSASTRTGRGGAVVPRSPAAARSSTGGLGVLGGSATGGEYGELGEEVVVDPGEVEA